MADFLPIHSGLIESVQVFYNNKPSTIQTICVVEADDVLQFIIVDKVNLTRIKRFKLDIRKKNKELIQNLLDTELQYEDLDIVEVWGFSSISEENNFEIYSVIVHIINKNTNKNYVFQYNFDGFSIKENLVQIVVYNFMFDNDNIPLGIFDNSLKIVTDDGETDIRNLGLLYVEVKRQPFSNPISGNKVLLKRFVLPDGIPDFKLNGFIDESEDERFPIIKQWERDEVLLELPDDTQNIQMDFSIPTIFIKSQ